MKHTKAQNWGLVGIIGVVFLLGWMSFLTDDAEIISKKPEDESVTFITEKDLRTGEIFDVQVIRCKKCGDVISYVRFRHGIPVWGNITRNHECGRHQVANRYTGSGMGRVKQPDFGAIIDYYQRRMRLRD